MKCTQRLRPGLLGRAKLLSPAADGGSGVVERDVSSPEAASVGSGPSSASTNAWSTSAGSEVSIWPASAPPDERVRTFLSTVTLSVCAVASTPRTELEKRSRDLMGDEEGHE